MHSNRLLSSLLLLAVPSLLQSCAVATPTDSQAVQEKPAFTIKIDRDKSLPQKSADDASLDKFFADEIEQPGLSHERFDHLMADAIVKSQPGLTLVGIKDHGISLKRPSGEEFQNYTDNSWAACKDTPGQRKVYLRTMLATMKEFANNQSAPKTIKDVVPIIRSAATIEDYKKLPTKGQKPLELAWYPLAPGMICLYAHDAPNSLSMVNADEATKFGLTAKDLKKGPLKTLHSHLPTDVSVYSGSGLFMVNCGGDFESSLILDDQIMNTIKQHVQGRLVFGVAAKDVLILSGDSDKKAIETLRRVVERAYSEAPRSVSDKLYYWDDGKISLCP